MYCVQSETSFLHSNWSDFSLSSAHRSKCDYSSSYPIKLEPIFLPGTLFVLHYSVADFDGHVDSAVLRLLIADTEAPQITLGKSVVELPFGCQYVQLEDVVVNDESSLASPI